MKVYRIKALVFHGISGQLEWATLPHDGVVEIRKNGNQLCWKIFIGIGERINECILKGMANSSEQAKEEAEKAWQDYLRECLETAL